MESSCNRKEDIFNFGTNIYVHMLFLFTILSSLFIFVISKISSDVINHEITNIVNDNITDYYKDLKENDKQNVKNMLNMAPLELLSRYYDQPEKVRETNNNNVFKTLYTLITVFILVFIIIIAISKLLCHKLPIKEILIENLIIFSGIGVVEFLFFYYIILKFIPTKPSFIVSYTIESIKKKLKLN